MIIGTPKEIKESEYRIGLTPSSAKEYILNGHTVLIEKDAGLESGFSNEDYINVGCKIIDDPATIWNTANMIIKVKEPLVSEYKYFREGLIIYAYLHLASNDELTKELLRRKTTGVAYETISEDGRTLPCLRPMSEAAGRLSIIEGMKHLQKHNGGRGILLSGLPGVRSAHVMIIGTGVVGINALKMAVGLGARVTILGQDHQKLVEIDNIYSGKATTLYSSEANIAETIKSADLVVGAVLTPGGKTPKLIRREYYKTMPQGSVIVDVSIDQGGITEVARPTTHLNPTYVVDGIIHYCVPNMPSSVARTTTEALSNNTVKYGLLIANKGNDAFKMDALKLGLNTFDGKITNKAVAMAFNMKFETI